MFLRFDCTLFSTSILLVQALTLSTHIASSKLPSNPPSVQNGQKSSQSHKDALIKIAASPLTHAPNVSSSSLKLYHYHHSPTRKRAPAQAVTCSSSLFNWTHVFSLCERHRSPQAYFVLCQLTYGPGPHQHSVQHAHEQCSDNEICVNTKHDTQAYCVPFENFAQKSFEKFIGVVTDPAATIALSVAEAVLTRESLNEGMVGQTLALDALGMDQRGSDVSMGIAECEDCESLTMEDIPTGTTGLEVRASVAGDGAGNLFVITQV
ncbi:hypothetical protein MMC34_006078 [Xylographa carneopallida]|nr:hypothetical protein [Xylographa carneopallida]